MRSERCSASPTGWKADQSPSGIGSTPTPTSTPRSTSSPVRLWAGPNLGRPHEPSRSLLARAAPGADLESLGGNSRAGSSPALGSADRRERPGTLFSVHPGAPSGSRLRFLESHPAQRLSNEFVGRLEEWARELGDLFADIFCLREQL